MEKKINLVMENNLGINEFTLTFNNLTYDIYYETFNQDLHVAYLRAINQDGHLSRSIALRIAYALYATNNSTAVNFLVFLNSLTGRYTDFTDDWGPKLNTLITDVMSGEGLVKKDIEDELEDNPIDIVKQNELS